MTESVDGIASAVGNSAGGEDVDTRPDEEGGAAEPGPQLEDQDGADRQEPSDERRQERAEQEARAEGGDEQPDLASRKPLALADQHDRQQEPRAHEVGEAEEHRAGSQERLIPDETKALGQTRAQRCRLALPLLLERCAHRQQRDRRERVRDCVDHERK